MADGKNSEAAPFTIAQFLQEKLKITRGFGSFGYEANVEELISQSDEEYKCPEIKIKTPDVSDAASVRFGHEMKKKYFLFDDKIIFLNHGAFGAALKPVLESAQAWNSYGESQPNRFFDRELLQLLVYVYRRLSKFVGCSPKNLVMFPNVTSATACVLHNQHFQKGDIIYCFDAAYVSVKNLLNHICDQTGAVLHQVTVPHPVRSKIEILELIKSTLKPGTKFAVFDHIPSTVPIIFPVKEIVEYCHSLNVTVHIDGAHGLGTLDLNLEELGADYYVTNIHKWFACPKSAALLCVNEKSRKSIRPLIVSTGFGSGFTSDFMWAGTRDYSPILSVNTCLDFWETVGVDKIRNYIYGLARDAGNLLTKAWSTDLFFPSDLAGAMVNVRLPEKLYKGYGEANFDVAESITDVLLYKYNIQASIKVLQGQLYFRISCHIYNCIDDYTKLANAVLEMMEQEEDQSQKS